MIYHFICYLCIIIFFITFGITFGITFNKMIKSLYIAGVSEQYSANYIANLLCSDGIATVSRITFLPEDKLDVRHMDPNLNYYKAYIEILYWHDNDNVNHMIHSLLTGTCKVLLTYDGVNVWEVKINKRASICYNPAYQSSTTIFTPMIRNNTSYPTTVPYYYNVMPYYPVVLSTNNYSIAL